ncbi:MAG TPA: hypothetical protein VN228_12865 [Pyrinomonadaceae bacterium]|nr:hypothetical protein [Pyrinomonadaceae bacterium]
MRRARANFAARLADGRTKKDRPRAGWFWSPVRPEPSAREIGFGTPDYEWLSDAC